MQKSVDFISFFVLFFLLNKLPRFESLNKSSNPFPPLFELNKLNMLDKSKFESFEFCPSFFAFPVPVNPASKFPNPPPFPNDERNGKIFLGQKEMVIYS